MENSVISYFRNSPDVRDFAANLLFGISAGMILSALAPSIRKIATETPPQGRFHIIDLTGGKEPVTKTVSLELFEAAMNIEELNSLRTSEGWLARTQKQWKQVFNHTCYMTCVVKDGQLIGTGSIGGNGRMGYIYDLVVRQDSRKKGIGTMIMNDLIRQAKANDYFALGLDTSHPKIISFYQKFGFKENPNSMKALCSDLVVHDVMLKGTESR
jgi:GNAT superfamily N-acetyltransferase